MKPTVTLISRGIVYLIGIAVIVVCGVLLPELAREEAMGKMNPPSAYPFLIGAWIVAIPIFVALYQTLQLLKLVDINKAFSKRSLKTLQIIKYSCLAFSALIIAGAIAVITTARNANPTEDITPVVTVGLIFAFVPCIIVTFVTVLQKLLHNALSIKSENELTI